jgi:hypothetical protein
MKAINTAPVCFEFCFAQLDTLVRVEEWKETVVIRASRASFSEKRKESFIRELVSEGFIADEYRWTGLSAIDSPRGVRWLVDTSWLMPDPAQVAGTRRVMVRMLVSAALLWLGLMCSLLLR